MKILRGGEGGRGGYRRKIFRHPKGGGEEGSEKNCWARKGGGLRKFVYFITNA